MPTISGALRGLARWPLTVIGLSAAGFWVAWIELALPYDDGGPGSLLFFGSYILGAPYLLAYAFWTSLLSFETGLLSVSLSFALGLLPYAAVDGWLQHRKVASPPRAMRVNFEEIRDGFPPEQRQRVRARTDQLLREMEEGESAKAKSDSRADLEDFGG